MFSCKTAKVPAPVSPPSTQKPAPKPEPEKPKPQPREFYTALDVDVAPAPREFRGVWIATVANIDWPSSGHLDLTHAKKRNSSAFWIITNP
jgi:hypothetical protein